MKSPVVKRSIVVAGHKTSVSLEEAFWNGMKEISGLRNMTLSELVGEIDGNRQQGNLSSAIRLFVLDYFRTRAIPPAAHAGSRAAAGVGRDESVLSNQNRTSIPADGSRASAIGCDRRRAAARPPSPIGMLNKPGRCRAAFRAPRPATDIPRSRCRRSPRSG